MAKQSGVFVYLVLGALALAEVLLRPRRTDAGGSLALSVRSKAASLIVALLTTYLAFNPLVKRGASGIGIRSVTALTLVTWLVVAMAGRWIGFS